MKILPNSLKRLHQIMSVNDTVTGILIQNTVADDRGALRRTNIRTLHARLNMASPIEAEPFQSPVFGIMSVPKWAIVQAMTEKTIDDYLDNSVLAVSVSAERTVIATPSDDVLQYFTTKLNDNSNQDVVTPFTPYDTLICTPSTGVGADFYIWGFGGSFDSSARVTVEYERVELTDAEYTRYFAGC